MTTLLVIAVPVAIVSGLRDARTVSIQAVFGAIAIYLIVGLAFALAANIDARITGDAYFAQTRTAKIRGYKANRFSFNVRGGRCEECQGQGSLRVALQLLPDLRVPCPACQGSRFNRATLEIRSGATNERPMAVLGFDETFLRPFTRALVEASTTRIAHRMTISEGERSGRHRVVEYVTGNGAPLTELVLTPHDHVVLVGTSNNPGDPDETLFQLPRTDSFLRVFTKMTFQADQTLRDTLAEMEKLARRQKVG